MTFWEQKPHPSAKRAKPRSTQIGIERVPRVPGELAVAAFKRGIAHAHYGQALRNIDKPVIAIDATPQQRAG